MSDGAKFAILRTQKLKHVSSIRRSLEHSLREQETPNADQSRTPENSHIGANSTLEAMAAVRSRLPEKRRKDAVLAIEYLITASPEAMAQKSREQQDDYFADSLDWLRERHGADNVVYAGIHRDETTPHMYAYVVPLDSDTGRLNAKKWLGGSKALSQMQTEFAEKIGKPHEFERGIQRSKARHQTVRRFYADLNAAEQQKIVIEPEQVQQKLMKKGVFFNNIESFDSVAARMTREITEKYQEMIARASLSSQERLKAETLQKTTQEQQKRLQAIEGPFKGLSKAQATEVVRMALGMQKENQRQEQLRTEKIREQFMEKRQKERERGSRGFSR